MQLTLFMLKAASEDGLNSCNSTCLLQPMFTEGLRYAISQQQHLLGCTVTLPLAQWKHDLLFPSSLLQNSRYGFQ